ncbi:MAG: DUF3037 domain-containing protein [Polyangiales bacterium]|nr:DUF3037 domain-containing protein [Sandaracinaceae bacterium]
MKSPCEALVIGYRPDLVAAESLNIGVLVACPERNFLGAMFLPSFRRITAAFPAADKALLRGIAKAIETGCEHEAQDTGSLFPTSAESFFRRFVPDTAGAIRITRTVAGVTSDPAQTLRETFERHVSCEGPPARRTQSDDDLWRRFSTLLESRGLLAQETTHEVQGPNYTERFAHAWKNGVWHVAQPVSLDLTDSHRIRLKAIEWAGRLQMVEPALEGTKVYLLVGATGGDETQDEAAAAKQDALAILRDKVERHQLATVVREDGMEELADRLQTAMRA